MFGPFKKKNEEEAVETQETTDQEQTQPEETVSHEEYDAIQAELASVKDQLVRMGADFQNFKKRTERDRVMWSQTIVADIFVNILPVIDNFDRALEHAKQSENSKSFASWLAGFELIYKSFNEYLKKNKIEQIEQMQTFDPNLHEALMQVDDSSKESGTIIQVFERGFILDGKVLRPAKVSVSK